MGETIRVRLTLWYVGFLAILLLAFAGIVTAAQLRNEAVELDETLRSAAIAAQSPLQATDAVPMTEPLAGTSGRLKSRDRSEFAAERERYGVERQEGGGGGK